MKDSRQGRERVKRHYAYARERDIKAGEMNVLPAERSIRRINNQTRDRVHSRGRFSR